MIAQVNSGHDRHLGMVTVASYAVLAYVYAGALLHHRGLYSETVMVELSQSRTWWDGFFYPFDSSRRLMSVSNHLGYVLSNGSYLALNVLFGLYVIATGILTNLLVRALVPNSSFLAFAAGAVALVFGADRDVNFLPHIVVRQSAVMALAAAVLFVSGFRLRRVSLMIGAMVAQAFSLWTYEAALPAFLLAPVMTCGVASDRRAWLRWSAVWEFVPLWFTGLLVARYRGAGATSYQAAKLQSGLSVGHMLDNLRAIAAEGLAFWRWPLNWFHLQAADCGGPVVRAIALPLVLGALTTFVVVWLLTKSRTDRHQPRRVGPPMIVAAFFVLLCYAPFAALPDVWLEGGTWRAQTYAAIPAAVFFAMAMVWIAQHNRFGGAALCVAIVTAGLASGLVAQLSEMKRWHAYRKVMTAIVAIAPRLKQDSLLALVNVPTPLFQSVCEVGAPFDPFSGDQMWFNSGLQVLYPGTRLVGLYWTPQRVSPGSIQFDFDKNGARLRHTTITVKGEAFRYDQMVAFAYDRQKGAILLDGFPADWIPNSVASTDYHPTARILPGPPPIETLQKLITED